MSGWKHNQLAHDLAGHLRGGGRLVWEDMQLGPAGSPRPDVYTLAPSFARFQPLAYECKISVSDFRSDVTTGKWQSYLKYAAGVIFAVPAGLISKDDIPAGCGLIVRHENVWRTTKKPTLAQIDTLPREAWLKLLIDGVERLRRPIEPRRAGPFLAENIARKKLGDRIAALMRDVDGAERRLERQKQEIEDATQLGHERLEQARQAARFDMKEVDSVRAELAEALGLSADASVGHIRRAAQTAAEQLTADPYYEAAQSTLDAMEREIRRRRLALPPIAQGAAE